MRPPGRCEWFVGVRAYCGVMHMACEAAFMGGPANGHIQVFPGDEPPAEYSFDQFLGFDHDPPAGKVTYIRQVSQMDQGPLWVFVPKAT